MDENIKIFGIGDNKTGTTSLGTALEILGYNRLAHWPNSLRLLKWYNNNIHDILNKCILYANDFNNFNDFPWNLVDFYKYFDKNFPNSKFILTIRDPQKWFNSFLNFNTIKGTNKSNLLWRLKRSTTNKKDIDSFTRLIKQKYNVDDISCLEKNKDKYILSYNNRNQQVIKYFKERPSDFLIVNWEKETNNWKKLCSFLNKPIPKKRFPHLMESKYVRRI